MNKARKTAIKCCMLIRLYVRKILIWFTAPTVMVFFDTNADAVDNLVYATFTANTYCVASEETHVAM